MCGIFRLFRLSLFYFLCGEKQPISEILDYNFIKFFGKNG